MEQELHKMHRLESIGTLAGGIAHDFNNILSSVIGFTELALDDVEKGSPIEDSLQEIFAGGKRARDLVKQILSFARQSDDVVKPIQIDTIAQEVLALLRASIPTTIQINPDHDALNSFSIDGIKNGATTMITGASGRYFWRDGKVIDKDGKVILDATAGRIGSSRFPRTTWRPPGQVFRCGSMRRGLAPGLTATSSCSSWRRPTPTRFSPKRSGIGLR